MQETQDMQVGSPGQDPLEEEMATHSSIFAWEIHGQGRLVSYCLRGCKRVRHNLATKQQKINMYYNLARSYLHKFLVYYMRYRSSILI